MIVPSNRLLVIAAVVFLTAGVVASVSAGLATMAGIIAAIAIAVFAFDVVSAAPRMRALSIKLPDTLRFVRGREGEIPVGVTNQGHIRGDVTVGLALPVDIIVEQPQITIPVPEPGTTVITKFVVKPMRRGSFRVQQAGIEIASPLGFWLVRQRSQPSCELRVYADLRTDQRVVAPLVTRSYAGLHVQRQLGRGRDFEKLREYLPGDPMNEIHWKATARRAKPVTRVYQIERTQEVYAIIDSSRLTARVCDEKSGETISDRYVTSGLILAVAAQQQGDLFGLVTFSDSVHTFLRAASGPVHFQHCRDATLNVQPELVAPDYNEVCSVLQTRLRRRAMLVFLTELDDPVLSEDFLAAAEMLSHRHLVVVASVRDKSAVPLFTTPAGSVDHVYDHLRGHFAWKRLDEVATRLRQHGMQFSAVDQSQLALELARVYLNAKRRQAI